MVKIFTNLESSKFYTREPRKKLIEYIEKNDEDIILIKHHAYWPHNFLSLLVSGAQNGYAIRTKAGYASPIPWWKYPRYVPDNLIEQIPEIKQDVLEFEKLNLWNTEFLWHAIM